MPVSGLREPLHHAGGPQHGERARVQPGARAPPPLPAATTHRALPPARRHGDHRSGLHLHLLTREPAGSQRPASLRSHAQRGP